MKQFLQGMLLIGIPLLPLPLSGNAAAQTGSSASPKPLTRYIPGRDLAACWEFEGLDAHAAAWKNTAASKLLTETRLGALLEDLGTQVIEAAQQSVPPRDRIPASEYLTLMKHGARHGLAAAVFGKGPRDVQWMLVVRNGNRPEFTRLLEAGSTAGPGGANGNPQAVLKAGRTLKPLGPDGLWWNDGDDLILAARSAADTILDVAGGSQPSAVDHPVLTALARRDRGVEPASVGFVDFTALPPLPPDAARLGLDGIKRIEMQWGFQGDALVTTVHLATPAPRRGVLALLDQPTFDLRKLPPIPAGQHAFLAASVDLARTFERLAELSKPPGANGEGPVDALDNAVRAELGLNLREDLLRPLGPRLAIYAQEAAPLAAGNPLAAMVAPYTGLTISLEVRDHAAMGARLEGLIKAINALIARRPGAGAGGVEPPEFRRRNGPVERVRPRVPARLGAGRSARDVLSDHRAG